MFTLITQRPLTKIPFFAWSGTTSLLKSAYGGDTRGAAELLGISPEQLLDFSANINPLGMPASSKRATVDNLDCAERYPDIDYAKLHAALAEYHQVSASWILVGNGETESTFTLVQGLKPRHMIVVTPGSAEHRQALRRGDCTTYEFALREDDGWQLTDAVLDTLTSEPDCLLLCTPNDPTDLLPDNRLLREIAARCELSGINLILDGASTDFTVGKQGLTPLPRDNPHIRVLCSLTKLYVTPGLWLGYLVNSNEQVVAQIRRRQTPWSISAFAALAGEIILHDSAHQQATWKWLEQEGARFDRQLKELPSLTAYPGRTNYHLLRCDRADSDLQRAMLEQHTLIRSCANYPGSDACYYRVAIHSQEENNRPLVVLRKVLSGTIPAD